MRDDEHAEPCTPIEPTAAEPALTADIVEDEAALAEVVEAWSATQVLPWSDDIRCFEAALRESVDAGGYALLDRLLGLVRAAADERLVRGVRWGFEQGRRCAVDPKEASS